MSTLCESKPRVGVKIIGTTMKPDFHRNEGEPPCRSNEAFEDPLSCPQDHPIQMENACCWSYRRKADSNCDGDLIQKDDPASCCPDEKLFQPLDCQQFKRKCISLSPENGPELEIPPQAFRTYLVGGVKRGYTTKCFSKSACIGKIKNKLDSVPLDFNDGFADQVNEFQLTTTGGLGIALVIRLDPPHIKLKNVRLDMHSGSSSGRALQDVRTYVIGAPKIESFAGCNSIVTCTGKLLNHLNMDPVDFSDGFTDKISTFDIDNTPFRSVALDIRIDTLFVIHLGVTLGSFLCQIKCLN
eukprot:TCALIF_08920-PA protein Name:"Protein of unknown function" AED:0.23 eAED:0.23 QI:41/0/0.5/1/0.66/0.75/4/0/297